MGGEATFAGTTYQAGVIAYVATHILTQSRLGWFGDRVDDTPIAIAGEVNGPGDDASVELVSARSFEFQSKHGLTGGAKFRNAIDRIVQTGDDSLDVVVVLDRNSTKALYERVADDLDRLRTGRNSPLGPDITALLEAGIAESQLSRIRTVAIDVDKAGDPESKAALQLLITVLESRDQAPAAWALLTKDAGEMCARQGQRTRKELVDLLEANGIRVAPLPKDAPWHRNLDFIKHLLNKRHAPAALMALDQLERDIKAINVDPQVRYRMNAQRGSAYLQLEKYDQAVSAANSALQYNPNGTSAYATAAYASMSLGNIDEAKRYAQAAVDADNADPVGWSALAIVLGVEGQSLSSPPVSVAVSTVYRTALLQAAFNAADWDGLNTGAGELLADGVRSAEVLYFKAVALLYREGGAARRELLAEAERVAAEAVLTIADDFNPLTVKCLVLQAQAQYRLGDQAAADALSSRARQLDPQDIEVVGSSAQLAISQGKSDEALAILQTPVVEKSSLLLSFRAKLLADNDDPNARKDVLAAIQLASDAPDPDLARLSAAEAAIMIPDAALAQQTLDLLAPIMADNPKTLLMRGRIEAERGNTAQAIKLYDQAAQRDPLHAHEFHAEIGARLVRDAKPVEALAEFDKVSFEQLPKRTLPLFASALYAAGELVRAQSLVNDLAAKGPLPDWAVAMAIDIATRQGDLDNAITHLLRLVDDGSQTPDLKIDLARRLLEVRRENDARPHIDDLLNQVTKLNPLQKMAVAQLLHHVGRDDDAVPLAFKSFREKQADPRMHGAFVTLVFTSKGEPEHPTTVGADTHIELKSDNGGRKRYTIYGEGPIDPTRSELSTADAASLGLIGLKVGDRAPLKSMIGEQWTVESIQTALIYAVNDVAAHFAERFPTERPAFEGIAIGDGSSVSDFAPIIRTLQMRKERTQAVFDLYRKDIPPLGFVAKMTGVLIPHVMQQASALPDTCGPLFVEWSDRDGQQESRDAARDAKEIVLTRSALETAARLGLLDLLAANFTVLVPQSLLYELDTECAEELKKTKEGESYLGAGDTGLTLTEIPPQHPAMVKRSQHVENQLAWVRAHATMHPRPLEKLKLKGTDEEQARDFVGNSSMDAVELADHRRAAMYADDLGLRKFMLKGAPARSFSTPGFLAALSDRAIITADLRDQKLLDLVRLNYAPIPVSVELLSRAAKDVAGISSSDLRQVFRIISAAPTSLPLAAQILARVGKRLVTASVQVRTLSEVLGAGLEAMAGSWPRTACAAALIHAARTEFLLLPETIREIEEQSIAFAKPGFLLD